MLSTPSLQQQFCPVRCSDFPLLHAPYLRRRLLVLFQVTHAQSRAPFFLYFALFSPPFFPLSFLPSPTPSSRYKAGKAGVPREKRKEEAATRAADDGWGRGGGGERAGNSKTMESEVMEARETGVMEGWKSHRIRVKTTLAPLFKQREPRPRTGPLF